MTSGWPRSPTTPWRWFALSDALLRLQRVNNDGRAVITAETHLRRFLEARPSHYEARRMLAAVLLSQHRFGEAIAEANRTRAADPRDAWNYGAIGDGYMELGDYDRAFDAFDRMGQLAPGPSAYARTSTRSKSKAISTALSSSCAWPPTGPRQTIPNPRRGISLKSAIC